MINKLGKINNIFLTLILCNSTNGYISSLLIIIAFLFKNSLKSISHSDKIIKKSLIFGFFYYIFY